MKSNKLKKGCAIGLFVSILLIIGFVWMIKEGLSNTHSTIIIEKPFGQLIVEETYGADFAQEFYEVSFSLVLKNNDTLNLGNGLYHDDSWKKKIELIKIDDWYGLITNYSSRAKLELTNVNDNKSLNVKFNLDRLRNDSIWKLTNSKYPDWTYEGSSTVKSINGNTVFVDYKYRLGINEPFEYKTQQAQYLFDTEKGIISTIEVGEAITDK